MITIKRARDVQVGDIVILGRGVYGTVEDL